VSLGVWVGRKKRVGSGRVKRSNTEITTILSALMVFRDTMRNDGATPVSAVSLTNARFSVYQYTQVNSRDVIKAIEADGWFRVAQKGSHVQFKHPTKAGRVTVPHQKREIPRGTLRSIERQSGVSLR
jgi:predicted RNA binding protein YcfA (HicA-like mRNA interferase family)